MNEQALKDEARVLYRAFFPGEVPGEVAERYREANVKFEAGSADPIMQKIVRLGLDAEAIEFWLRVRRGPSVVTRKVQILFYLLEPRARYYPWFVGEPESRLHAVAGLVGAVARSGWKLLKGAWLVRRHGIV